MTSNTRSKILAFLRKNRSASAAELGRALNLTGANIRHHLSNMERDGQITSLGPRKEAKGRPTIFYGASDQVLGTGLRALVEAMLDIWVENAHGDEQDHLLKSLARNLAAKASQEPTTGASRRLGQAVDRLNELHYQAQWEAGARGARVILGHCPYSEIIERHPELCRMDAFLLEDQSGMRASQVSKLERGKDGTRRCIFSME